MLRHAHGDSFPSGHAMGSTVVLGAVSYLAFRTATRWRWKAACVALAWTLILGIALSTTLAYETLRRIRMLRERRASGP